MITRELGDEAAKNIDKKFKDLLFELGQEMKDQQLIVQMVIQQISCQNINIEKIVHPDQ